MVKNSEGSVVQSKVSAIFKCRSVSILLIFLSLLLPLLIFITKPLYVDEADNIIVAKVLLNGGLIYRDYYSQHTPFMYYLLTIPLKIGINTLIELRIFFYIFMAAAMAVLVVRYRSVFGTAPLVVGSILLFTSYNSNPAVAYAILSDQVQAICYVALLLILLKFHKTRTIGISDLVIASLAIFVSVGVAMISIYYAFVFILGILLQQFLIMSPFNSLKPPLPSQSNFKSFILFTLKLIILFLVPFIAGFSFLILTHNVSLFVRETWTMNRDIYVIYSGIGSSIIQPFFDSTNYLLHGLLNALRQVRYDFFNQSRMILNFVGIFGYCMLIFFKKKSKMLAFVILLMITLSAMRGTGSFHGTPFWATSSFCFALLIFENWSIMVKDTAEKASVSFRLMKNDDALIEIGASNSLRIKRNIKNAFLVLTFCAVLIPSAHSADDFLKSIKRSSNFPTQPVSKEYLVQKILKPGEHFFTTSLDLAPFINSGVTPAAKTAFTVPWFTQMFESQIIANLRVSQTPLIFHNANSGFSSNEISNYAPRLNSFILENYTPLLGDFDFYWQDWISGKPIYQPLDTAYILKSRFSSTVEKLRQLKPTIFNNTVRMEFLPSSNQRRTGEILDSSILRQTFKVHYKNFESIHLMFSKYGARVTSSYRVDVLREGGHLVKSFVIDARSIPDNSFIVLQFPPEVESTGKNYEIVISPNHNLVGGDYNASTGNSLLAWITDPNVYSEGKLSINNIDQPNTLVMRLGFRN